MEPISEDIYISIDTITIQVEDALEAISSSSGKTQGHAVELCHKASGTLSTILQFKYFKTHPHQVLSTCLEALEVAAIHLNDRLYRVGHIAPPASPRRSEDNTPKSYGVTGMHDREENTIALCDIIGNDAAKEALLENVVLPLQLSRYQCSQIFKGIRSGSGNVLLYGPPGCGKTILAQAVAKEANAQLYAVRPSDVLSKYQGESERYLSSLFATARTHCRSIIFFDEFDCIAITRGCSEEGLQCRRLLSELLIQLSQQQKLNSTARTTTTNDENCSTSNSSYSPDDAADVAPTGRVIVVAATNRLQDLDEAVIRRFDTKVFVGLPDELSRAAMVQFYLRDLDHTAMTEPGWLKVTGMTDGWSGSEIEILCREAAMYPLREELNLCNGDIGCYIPDALRSINTQDFERAHSVLMVRTEEEMFRPDESGTNRESRVGP